MPRGTNTPNSPGRLVHGAHVRSPQLDRAVRRRHCQSALIVPCRTFPNRAAACRGRLQYAPKGFGSEPRLGRGSSLKHAPLDTHDGAADATIGSFPSDNQSAERNPDASTMCPVTGNHRGQHRDCIRDEPVQDGRHGNAVGSWLGGRRADWGEVSAPSAAAVRPLSTPRVRGVSWVESDNATLGF